MISPLILAKMIDSITTGKSIAFSLILLYFIMLAVTGGMESAREGLLTVLGQKITHALRSSLMDKFTELTTDEVNAQEPGAVVSRFVGDVDTVEKLFTSGIISMFADACKIISILVVVWFQNRGLTITLCVLLPFVFCFTRHVQKNMLASQIQNRKAVARASGHVPETLHNIRTIHCLGKEQYMQERYDAYISESYEAMERTNFYDAIYSPSILILNAAVVAFVMLLSASGNKTVMTFFGMSAGTAVAVINYISQVFSPVESLGMAIQTIQSAVAGIHRINEFFELEEQKDNAKDTAEMQRMEIQHDNRTFVEFSDVTFGYDEHMVLENLNLKIMDGDQVTRKLFGYVEQTFHMVPGTVRDQITLFDETISEEMVRQAADLTGLKETIDSLEKGYDTECTKELFSQGQWQLLSIARAAAANPGLLLLDEITANLDAETEKKILEALKRVAQNRTVISISHRTAADFGRTIAL